MQCSFRWHFSLFLQCMFLQVTLFWTLSCLLCNVPSGDTILISVFSAMFLLVTLFWTLSSMPCSFRWHYFELCLFLQMTLFWALFNAMFLFWTLSSMQCSFRWHYSRLCSRWHVPSGDLFCTLSSMYVSSCDTGLCLVFYAMFLQVTLFCTGTLSSMPCSFRSQYSGLSFQCNSPSADTGTLLFWNPSTMLCSCIVTLFRTPFLMPCSFRW